MYNLQTIRYSLLISMLLLVANAGHAQQQYKELDRISTFKKIPEGYAVIYGSFIQRLGFTSGGFQQAIQLMDIDTKEVYAFSVKPAITSAKQNPFMYFIKAGRYAILNYLYCESKWYGGKIFSEPIRKASEANNVAEETESDPDHEYAERFIIEVTANKVNYLGTWHFDAGEISFSADKETIDKKLLKATKEQFGFNNASISLPK